MVGTIGCSWKLRITIQSTTSPRQALLERSGNWNSVWKRFDRLSKAGVFEAFFDNLASLVLGASGADARQHRGARPWLSGEYTRGQEGQDLAARAAASPPST